MRIASIGYQKKSLEGLASLLASEGITALVDVRDRAWSNRPEFRKQRLAGGLRDVGVDYIHLKAAGNPTRPKRGERASVEACARAYRAHLAERPDAIEQVLAVARTGYVALFCYEHRTCDCHRGILLDELRLHVPDLDVVELPLSSHAGQRGLPFAAEQGAPGRAATAANVR